MNDHDFNIKGYVKLVSVEPRGEADFANIGGFSISAKNEDIRFDWYESTGYSEINEKGHFELDWTLTDFDVEFFKDSNNTDEFDLNKIASAVIDEVYYEAGNIVDGEEIHFEMDLVEFELYAYIGSTNHKETYAFSPEQVEAYNQKIKAERNKSELVNV